jgi:hypothetical protein
MCLVIPQVERHRTVRTRRSKVSQPGSYLWLVLNDQFKVFMDLFGKTIA